MDAGQAEEVCSEQRIPMRTMSSYVPWTHACWRCRPSITKPAFSYALPTAAPSTSITRKERLRGRHYPQCARAEHRSGLSSKGAAPADSAFPRVQVSGDLEQLPCTLGFVACILQGTRYVVAHARSPFVSDCGRADRSDITASGYPEKGSSRAFPQLEQATAGAVVPVWHRSQ